MNMDEKISAPNKDFPGDKNVEDEVFGKWFPRIGALALVMGAGFGFKYAIDQGWVGPRLRVMAGLLLASILIAIGDWTRKREWSAYAQAITGGGVGLMYLTLWAAVGIYGLLPASVGFICLIAVSGLGCLLAIRHESQALALLSLIGGFVNPFVTGASSEMPQGLYLYILSVDLAVVALSFIRPWNLLEKVAFVASWIVLEVGGGSPRVSLLAATGIFLMFGALPYARVLLRRDQGATDLALVPINGLLYYFAVFVRATGDLEAVRGPLALGLAAFFLAGVLIVRDREGEDGVVGTSSGVMSFFFLTLWAPVQLGVELMAFGWAVEALMLMGVAVMARDVRVRVGGWIVLTMATVTELILITTGPDSALEENYGRVVLIILVAAIYVGAYLEHRFGGTDLRDLAVVGANMLTLLWLSLEVYSAVWYNVATPKTEDLQFGLSGVWALYAGALLAIGIFFRARQARLMSLVLFGVTIAKMAVHDLWLLDTLQRLIGFAGIGALLLSCSLMYHRFREWFEPVDSLPGGAP
jgi:uncharacterized membrane protein